MVKKSSGNLNVFVLKHSRVAITDLVTNWPNFYIQEIETYGHCSLILNCPTLPRSERFAKISISK